MEFPNGFVSINKPGKTYRYQLFTDTGYNLVNMPGMLEVKDG